MAPDDCRSFKISEVLNGLVELLGPVANVLDGPFGGDVVFGSGCKTWAALIASGQRMQLKSGRVLEQRADDLLGERSSPWVEVWPALAAVLRL